MGCDWMLNASGGTIEFDVFQSILQHLPPSVFFVILKSAEERSSYAQSRSSWSR